MSSNQIEQYINTLVNFNSVYDACKRANMKVDKLTNRNMQLYKSNLKKRLLTQPDLFKTIRRLDIEKHLQIESEIDEIMEIPAANTKQSIPHDERKAIYDELQLQPGFYTKQSIPKEQRQEQFDEIKEIVNQFRKASDAIKHKETTINFNIEGLNDRSKQYFNSHIGVFFNKFIKSIKASEKWVIKYDFKDSSKTKPLDDQHIASLLGQMKREGYLNEIREEYANIDEAEYDFFTTDINELKQITITKIDDTRTNKNKNDIENDIVYQNRGVPTKDPSYRFLLKK